MNILILGSGGREHAIAWKIKQSPLCKKLYIAPGNAGTGLCGENININPTDFIKTGQFVKEKKIDILVVGPEEPLVKGIADYFSNNEELKNTAVIGPDSYSAKLEGSKDFAKSFMNKYKIPTSKYKSFNNETLDEGLEFLRSLNPPYVLKADGLAAGKGVLICKTLQEAQSYLKKMINERMFGSASDCVVIEEYLNGTELSVFIATDGENYIQLPEAKDYKRIGEGETGPNTGGMGCVSPVPTANKPFMEKVRKRIIEPTIEGLINENFDYKGFLFFGLMNVNGEPYVIEYNVRLGDPEAEVILPRIDSDFVQLLKHISNKTLNQYKVEIRKDFAATIMLASEGYPGKYEKGLDINNADSIKNSIVFYAGVKQQNDTLKTSGGRVMAITSLDSSLEKAVSKSISNAEIIDFKGKYYRKDIGNDLIQ